MKDEVILELLSQMSDRLSDISDSLLEITKIQASQQEILNEHVRRSIANEKALEVLKEELKPALSFMYTIKIVGKVLISLGGCTLFITLLERFFNKIF